MNAIQQKCRPKHQVLVLKCYPRTAKGAVDVKPNSSELSYLLFYATSRRSKIQKVGQFLEKKTASDVWRLRIGNVQVTLQILAALIEKSPKDLPLFAQNVLKILSLILRSNDITMVEASLPTFDTFCEHHDASSLFADQAYLRQYEDIVRTYATLASTGKPPTKGTPSKPVALRWRNAGLDAISSITTADALSSVSGRQLDTVVPMVLENLWTDNQDELDILAQRVHMEEKVDNNALLRRRTSVSTVRTAETGGDTNPIAISGTSGDIDKLAEEETGVAAMQCLKRIFAIPNRAQLHGATTALLKFTRERIQQKNTVLTQTEKGTDDGWAVKIFDLVTRWAPVQDRYVIMVVAMDTLLRTSPSRENMDEQIVLSAIVGSLLHSDINLIGLSVMDVLLSLIQHMKRILRHWSSSRTGASSADEHAPLTPEKQDPSPQQEELLSRIQQCMGDLATHVYYTDQISDMISCILHRLKPQGSGADLSSTTDKIDSTVDPQASVGNVSEEHQHSDALFSLDLAKVTALGAIKSILLVANPKTKLSGNISLRRNKVPIHVWEGTQWLLRDADGRVRKAYAQAFITWLDRETTRADLRAREENPSRTGNRQNLPATSARRDVSSTSTKERPARSYRSHFLQLLHLAIYDNAVQYVDNDIDIALLHILLARLVSKLGVNAVRFGIPMIFRLQEDIQETEAPLSKVRLGCLCHGYFWALSEQFDFEASAVGRAIQNEIIRRRSKNFWVEGVHIPSPSLEILGTPGSPNAQRKISIHEIESEALLPFDERTALVDCICTNYQAGTNSPPASPSASPGRAFSNPILSSGLSSMAPASGESELSSKFREEILIEWTRDTAMAAIQEGSQSGSFKGSKTGTTATHAKNRNGQAMNGHHPSGAAYAAHHSLRPMSNAGAHRKSSLQSRSSVQSGSVRGYVASVDQLKTALMGDTEEPAGFEAVREDDGSSDSMVSYEFTPSELSFNPQTAEGGGANEVNTGRGRGASRERKASNGSGGPLTSHPMGQEEEDSESGVPPVPPLPASFAKQEKKRNIESRGGDFGDSEEAGMRDLQSLLKGIDSKSMQNTLGNLSRPPY